MSHIYESILQALLRDIYRDAYGQSSFRTCPEVQDYPHNNEVCSGRSAHCDIARGGSLSNYPRGLKCPRGWNDRTKGRSGIAASLSGQFASQETAPSVEGTTRGTRERGRSESRVTNARANSFCSKRTEVNSANMSRTLKRVRGRLITEGISFLTKTLPRLGKAFDRALSSEDPFDANLAGFRALPGSRLPLFLGEFFSRVFDVNGVILPIPCVKCVRVIRQVLYLFYKYELPYTDEQEQQVVSRFENTEGDLVSLAGPVETLDRLSRNCYRSCREIPQKGPNWQVEIAHKAQYLLSKLFCDFDCRDIVPRHGPGAVATRQRLQAKYLWTNVSHKITAYFPFEEYFVSSLGEVADSMRIRKDAGQDYYYCDGAECRASDPYNCMGCRLVSAVTNSVSSEDLPARVILVPKDSRGPRLISCEPVDYQWIQQGLSAAIVRLVESHWITKSSVFFTDQTPNQRGALLGSFNGRYATLDLNEASDRVSLSLVRLLFPKSLVEALEACRSSSTVLPDGREIKLNKFAPMGSALCFPILGLTVWALLAAAAPNTDTMDGILVYGDDVIVPSEYSEDAMSILESFGLRINRDKSCTKGLFRESCGMDAFNGECVTPVKLKTVWSPSLRADVYSSWLDYSNDFYRRGYYEVAEFIGNLLVTVYNGAIPEASLGLSAPSLDVTLANMRPCRKRWSSRYQKWLYLIWYVKGNVVSFGRTGWHNLLRYFVEVPKGDTDDYFMVRTPSDEQSVDLGNIDQAAFSVRLYTERGRSMLRKRWRG